MDDDFNTPEAIAVLFDLANEVNKGKAPASQLKALANVLGLLARDANAFLQGDVSVGIDALIAARSEAKKAKNYAEADRIRKELLDSGIVLEDSASGTTWRRV
jgi:cysteinyl-tRNA synthetase